MFWWLFNNSPDIETESLACILEEYGPVFIDNEYRDLGVREGWLILDGWYRDHLNRLVFTYNHSPPL